MKVSNANEMSRLNKFGYAPESISKTKQNDVQKSEIKDISETKQTFQDINEKHIINAIEQANNSYVSKFTRFEFSIHEETKEIMVKVYDKETDELIREIPPEKILDMLATMWDLAGILVDDRV